MIAVEAGLHKPDTKSIRKSLLIPNLIYSVLQSFILYIRWPECENAFFLCCQFVAFAICQY